MYDVPRDEKIKRCHSKPQFMIVSTDVHYIFNYIFMLFYLYIHVAETRIDS